MCGAVVCFAILDTSAKFLMGTHDSLQVVWGRYTFAFLFSVLFVNPIARPELMRTRRPVLQVVRSALLVVATGLNFAALRYLQLDQALAILFSSTFFVAALSGPILGEWIGWRRWTAIGVGFVGVLVVIRPGFGDIPPIAGLTVLAALAASLYNIFTRVLARTDSNDTTLFYSNAVGALVMSVAVPFVWAPLSWFDWVLLAVAGSFGGFGHFLLIAGHRLAPAAILAPFFYTQLLWVTILGYVVFSDLPDHWTLAGAAIIVVSGVYLIYRERKVRGGAVESGVGEPL